jgi:hypothetical protein
VRSVTTPRARTRALTTVKHCSECAMVIMSATQTKTKRKSRSSKVSWKETMDRAGHKRLAEIGGLPPSELEDMDGETVMRDVEFMSEPPEIDTTVAHPAPPCHQSPCFRRWIFRVIMLLAFVTGIAMVVLISTVADDPQVLCPVVHKAADVANVSVMWQRLECDTRHNRSSRHW